MNTFSTPQGGFFVKVLLTIASVVAILLAAWYLMGFQARPNQPETTNPSALRPPGLAHEPHIRFNEKDEFAGMQHKDAQGLSPLEIVMTPEGAVHIQRTFKQDGTLLNEEAFLNGESVPVPKR
ncbi:MAG: hypothetical protein SFV81_13825 [Pirellulaceae bacterium]|nr:hypothetical protein [Pirellulaceae bacterium]